MQVLVELVWILERSYGFSRDAISTALLNMLATQGVVLETSDDVARAALSYRRGDAGFSDLMIAAASRRADPFLSTLSIRGPRVSTAYDYSTHKPSRGAKRGRPAAGSSPCG